MKKKEKKKEKKISSQAPSSTKILIQPWQQVSELRLLAGVRNFLRVKSHAFLA